MRTARGAFCGEKRNLLLGELADLQIFDDHVLARFDHYSTGTGWWKFKITDFDIIGDEDGKTIGGTLGTVGNKAEVSPGGVDETTPDGVSD